MSVHSDTLQGLQEALEYAQGNRQLKTTEVEVSDEEIWFYSVYSKLSEANKKRLIGFANDLLQTSSV